MGISGTVTLVAGIWLALHLTALADTFRGRADVVPARALPRTSRARVYTALALFNVGWIASIVIWSIGRGAV
ncbi:hypothetical protein B2G71_17485 [Novosphingobium sp. PC22D]|nr:hypothetical protein B2G71_17485 [Novosphingobium sp. PC22D]